MPKADTRQVAEHGGRGREGSDKELLRPFANAGPHCAADPAISTVAYPLGNNGSHANVHWPIPAQWRRWLPAAEMKGILYAEAT